VPTEVKGSGANERNGVFGTIGDAGDAKAPGCIVYGLGKLMEWDLYKNCTFLTKGRTTSRRITSSASFHNPRASYVRRYSVRSVIHLFFSNSVPLLSTKEYSVCEKSWSRSEDKVDCILSIR